MREPSAAWIRFLSQWRNCGLRLAWVGRVGRERQGEHRPPRTSHFLLLAVEDGWMEVQTGGRTYLVEPGRALLLPPEVRWREELRLPVSGPARQRRVFFDVITDHAAEHPLQVLLLPALGDLPLDDQHEDWWSGLMEQGPFRRGTSQPAGLIDARAAFDQLLASFLRRGVESGRFLRTASVDAPEWFTAWLSAAMPLVRTQISVDQLIAQSGYSRAAVFACFRRYLGRTPGAWLRERRIESGCRMLLAMRGTPVAVIAGRCGYRDANLFARHFRQLRGCSPTGWRNRHA